MNEERNVGGGLTGVAKLTVSITITVIACLAILLVFDIIPESVFSEAVQKVALLAVIVALAGGALALVARIGK
jgi:hypothetical protein